MSAGDAPRLFVPGFTGDPEPEPPRVVAESVVTYLGGFATHWCFGRDATAAQRRAGDEAGKRMALVLEELDRETRR